MCVIWGSCLSPHEEREPAAWHARRNLNELHSITHCILTHRRRQPIAGREFVRCWHSRELLIAEFTRIGSEREQAAKNRREAVEMQQTNTISRSRINSEIARVEKRSLASRGDRQTDRYRTGPGRAGSSIILAFTLDSPGRSGHTNRHRWREGTEGKDQKRLLCGSNSGWMLIRSVLTVGVRRMNPQDKSVRTDRFRRE
jgi:hypothetical protein